MEDKIRGYLLELEEKKGIKILLACETGSRAWGFPSPDSDFDVRIIYKHKTEWYLSLTEEKDTIECFFENNEIDISGWDIRKSLRLLWKSNPPLLERIQSPIIYRSDEQFLTGINQVAKQTYSRIATIHHYSSMAKKVYDEIFDLESFKLKRFFYGLRAALTCKWIIEKEQIPPIEFAVLLDGLEIENKIKKRIQELIEIKATKNESYLHSGDKSLMDLIGTNIEYADRLALGLPSSKGNMDILNKFFKDVIVD